MESFQFPIDIYQSQSCTLKSDEVICEFVILKRNKFEFPAKLGMDLVTVVDHGVLLISSRLIPVLFLEVEN